MGVKTEILTPEGREALIRTPTAAARRDEKIPKSDTAMKSRHLAPFLFALTALSGNAAVLARYDFETESNLAQTFQELDAARNTTRRIPGEKEIEGWIEQARAMDKVVEH